MEFITDRLSTVEREIESDVKRKGLNKAKTIRRFSHADIAQRRDILEYFVINELKEWRKHIKK